MRLEIWFPLRDGMAILGCAKEKGHNNIWDSWMGKQAAVVDSLQVHVA